MNDIPKSPYFLSQDERRAALFRALNGEETFSKDAEYSSKEEVSDEVETEQKAKTTWDVNTPWTVLLQHAAKHPGIVNIVQNRIEIAGDEEASEIAFIALKKCAMRLYKATESSLSDTYDILLEVLKNNRVSRRSLASAVRMYRALDAEDLEEFLEDQTTQTVIAEEAKQKARKQAQKKIEEILDGEPNTFSQQPLA